MKKAKKPCNICKGEYKEPCEICGWFDDWVDPHKAEGARQRVDFLTRLLARRTMSTGPIHPDVDREIMKHANWISLIYLRVRVGKESVDKIAKEETLTKKGLELVLALYSNWLRRHNKIKDIHDFLFEIQKDWINGSTERQVARDRGLPLSVVVGARRKNVLFDL